MNFHYWLFALNGILSCALVGVTLVKVDWPSFRKVRDFRIAGLFFISLAIAWSSLARRNQEFRLWHYLVTIGLSLCLYGMIRTSYEEKLIPKESRGSHVS